MIIEHSIIEASDGKKYIFETRGDKYSGMWMEYGRKEVDKKSGKVRWRYNQGGKGSRVATVKIGIELDNAAIRLGLIIPNTFFGHIKTRAEKQGYLGEYSRESLEWFRGEAEKLSGAKGGLILSETNLIAKGMEYGKLYFFRYVAKGHIEGGKKLKYWDEFPCVFPIESKKGGFLGINLHYLDIPLRAMLFDIIFEDRTQNELKRSTKLEVGKILEHIKDLDLIKPAVHRYLDTQVSSHKIRVESNLWSYALFLPVQRFRYAANGSAASSKTVWKYFEDKYSL